MTKIEKIDHIGIAVRSVKETLPFYERLGLSAAHSEVEPEQRVMVAFLPVGESQVELIEPTDEDSPVARFLDKRGEGIHHICFEVEDIESALRALEKEGIGLIDTKPRSGAAGKRIAFVHPKSAHGVLVELCERAPAERKPPSVEPDA